MKLLGIEFAPLFVPLHRRLETLAAAAWFLIMAFGGIFALLLTAYLLTTRLCLPTLLYCAWTFHDRRTPHTGGRPSAWVRSWRWWRLFRDYLPARLAAAAGCRLDPARNYLFCCFPHGMLPAGVFAALATDAGGFGALFPHHRARIVTLDQHYSVPFFRELALALGGIGASAAAIAHVLRHEGGGRVVGLMPGGAAEAYHCQPGRYRILLAQRKGFVKVALRCGAPLVPVVSFGETDLFEQMEGPRLRAFQERLRGYIGLAPVVPIGRGFFQYTFGIIPKRREVTTVVGKPIDVVQTDHPTIDEINELHKTFTEALINLFETEKSKYIKNSENIHLEI